MMIASSLFIASLIFLKAFNSHPFTTIAELHQQERYAAATSLAHLNDAVYAQALSPPGQERM